jgi:RHS repeat-associated protein
METVFRMRHAVVGTPGPTKLVWDVASGLPVILKETDSRNQLDGLGTNNTYVYGLGLISVTDRSGNQTYYTGDGLGSTTDLTNSSGTETDGYTYDAFGTPTHSPGSSANNFQFTSQQTDADSGLQYLRARYYDPAAGLFLGRDPFPGLASVPTTQKPYAYALNNPVNLADPSGRSVISFLNDLRPTFSCGWGDFTCIGAFLGAIEEYNDIVFGALKECAIWGVGGALAGPGGRRMLGRSDRFGTQQTTWTKPLSAVRRVVDWWVCFSGRFYRKRRRNCWGRRVPHGRPWQAIEEV